MKWIVFVLTMIVAILMVISYSLLAMLSNEKDEESKDERSRR
jgi:hypothetical protein